MPSPSGVVDPNRIFDGFATLEGGVDSGRAPNLIEGNQVASAENMVFRGGKPKTRPGIRLIGGSELISNPTHSYDQLGNDLGSTVFPPEQASVIFDFGAFQCARYYAPPGGDERIMFMISGRLFQFFPTPAGPQHSSYRSITDGHTTIGITTLTSLTAQFTTADLGASLTGDGMPPGNTIVQIISSQAVYMAYGAGGTSSIANITITQVAPQKVIDEIPLPQRMTAQYPYGWMVQADKWFIAQDGISAPVLYDGVAARYSQTSTGGGAIDGTGPEVPVGTMMTYGLGRLCVVLPNNQRVRFGDLYGSHGDLQDPGDSVILFTETTFLAEGFDAALPFEMGKITGITFFPQLDTSTGSGPLLVFAERGAASFFLDQPRDQWQFSTFEQLALLSTGLRGDKSITAVNEDLWFRADDGWRTYRQARSESTGWAHIPLSTNIRKYVDQDTPELLSFVSSIYFDNRLIGLAEPEWNFQVTSAPGITPITGFGQPCFNRMVVCDFDILSAFGTRNKPAWDGAWTHPDAKFYQVVTGTFNNEKRAFIFGKHLDIDKNVIFEISLADTQDHDDIPIPWELETRSFDFAKSGGGSSVFSETELYDTDLWLSDISNVDNPISVAYLPDNYPTWIPWRNFSGKFGLAGFPGSITPGGVPTATPGFSPRLSLGKPQYQGDFVNTNRNLRRGYRFQLKLNGSGHIQIDQLRVHAQKTVERFIATQPPSS